MCTRQVNEQIGKITSIRKNQCVNADSAGNKHPFRSLDPHRTRLFHLPTEKDKPSEMDVKVHSPSPTLVHKQNKVYSTIGKLTNSVNGKMRRFINLK